MAGEKEFLRVVIVEDEDIIRRGLLQTIPWQEMRCEVVGAAANGRQGLELLRTQHPDVVLLDIIMPEMTGIDMLAAAREEGLGGFASIILTSYAKFDYARQALQLKAAGYLLKPVDENELRQLLADIRQDKGQEPAAMVLAADELSGQEAEFAAEWDEYFRRASRNPYAEQTMHYISGHYREKITMDGLARQLEVSVSYLSRKLKEITGQTFLELLMHYRLQKAMALLRSGRYRVYEVSEQTGFNDYKHFCVVFKKYMNISPTDFIRMANPL